jgi:hypothetical protein
VNGTWVPSETCANNPCCGGPCAWVGVFGIPGGDPNAWAGGWELADGFCGEACACPEPEQENPVQGETYFTECSPLP